MSAETGKPGLSRSAPARAGVRKKDGRPLLFFHETAAARMFSRH